MKPTLRRNGKRMVTVRVTHHLTREDVMDCLIKEGTLDDQPTKRQIETAVRDVLTWSGRNGFIYAHEERDDDEIERDRGVAGQALAKLYDWEQEVTK